MILLSASAYHIDEIITGLIGVAFIGAAFLSSVMRNRKLAAKGVDTHRTLEEMEHSSWSAGCARERELEFPFPRTARRQRSNSAGEMPTALQASRTACFSSGSKLPSAPPMMMPTWITARAASGLLFSLPIVAIASTLPKS